LLNFKNRTNELHTQEAELERLIHEEMEKQYRKQQEQWKKEEVIGFGNFDNLINLGCKNQTYVSSL